MPTSVDARPDRGTQRAVTAAARCGLATRGLLYVLVALLALQIAFGDSGEVADSSGALHELAGRPFGRVLVWAVGLGLAAMALWRLSEAVFGATGPDGRKATHRAAAAGRAVFYAVVSFSTLAFAAGRGARRSSDEQSRDATATLLDAPAGPWLVAAVGAGIAVGGIVIVVGAVRLSFRDRLDTARLPEWGRRAVDVLGAVGGTARGAVFTAAGGFLVYAAVSYDPAKAKGVDDTLRSFSQTPAGPWLLVAVALGLLLFGLFSWAMAALIRA
ncbi:DUF1206 domain-containing protein [Streptomyces bambusae]|uniref:DUF1206 domain-containing protein n=1 Tax=Streptomyces bambusae TaxID=1550616 RepID=UPI001CFD53CE|nr:DUF1206 domain-containing protein [Streptomyces bambusae]MCB5168439.1 DUF1206 domain-containing protein [Streptomyces bambusae]